MCARMHTCVCTIYMYVCVFIHVHMYVYAWLINVVSSATQFEPLPEDDVVSAVGQALRDTLGMLNASNTCNMYIHCIELNQLQYM